RRLGGERAEELRRYLLGLAMVAASQPLDPFLRQGCILVPDDERPATWTVVDRAGRREPLEIDDADLLAWARGAAEAFGVAEPRRVAFDPKLAKADMGKGKKK